MTPTNTFVFRDGVGRGSGQFLVRVKRIFEVGQFGAKLIDHLDAATLKTAYSAQHTVIGIKSSTAHTSSVDNKMKAPMTRLPVRVDETVDNAPGVQKGETLGDLRHYLQDVSEMRIGSSLMHDVEKGPPMNSLLQNHHLIQNACDGENII